MPIVAQISPPFTSECQWGAVLHAETKPHLLKNTPPHVPLKPNITGILSLMAIAKHNKKEKKVDTVCKRKLRKKKLVMTVIFKEQQRDFFSF